VEHDRRVRRPCERLVATGACLCWTCRNPSTAVPAHMLPCISFRGVDLRAALLRVPQTVIDRHNVALSSSEVNPDEDTAAAGSAQLLLCPSGDAMGACDPYGHFVGQLTLRRLHHRGASLHANSLHSRHRRTQV
jgi:hypothetical protein